MKEMRKGFLPVTINGLSSWVAAVKDMRSPGVPLMNYSGAGVGVVAAVGYTGANNLALVSCHAMNGEASGGEQGGDERFCVHSE